MSFWDERVTQHHLLADISTSLTLLGQLSLLWSPRPAEEVEELHLSAASLRRSLDDQSRVLSTRLNEIRRSRHGSRSSSPSSGKSSRKKVASWKLTAARPVRRFVSLRPSE